jgi:hypothetical protein
VSAAWPAFFSSAISWKHFRVNYTRCK